MNTIEQILSERPVTKEENLIEEESAIVYKSNNYHKFKIIGGNRAVNKLHLNRLEKSMREKYLKVPIIVNDNNGIIDGQHRFLCAVKIGLPVYYIINPDYALPEVQRMNTNMTNWKSEDYMAGYADLGNFHYIKYKEYYEKYGFGHPELRTMLSGDSSQAGAQKFKEGTFEVTQEEEFLKTARKILQMQSFYDGYKRKSFVRAMITLFNNEKFNYDLFLKKVAYQRVKLVDCSTVRAYLEILEEIYNFNSKNPVYLRR